MFCTRCGTDNPADAQFCGKCGLAMTGAGTATFHYAGFWRRFVALVLDEMLVGCAGMAAAIPLGTLTLFGSGEVIAGTWIVYSMFLGLLGWVYHALMESSSWQATLGKRVLGVYVTDAAGQRLSLARATGRTLAKLLNSLTMGIGWVMAAFTDQKRGLHDYIAGTLVVRGVPAPRTTGVVVA